MRAVHPRAVRGKLLRLIVIGALLSLIVAPIAKAEFPTTADGLRTWAPTFMTWPLKMTEAKALTTARNQDVIVATKATFKPHVAKMKAVNPDLKILVYLNGALVPKEDVNPAWPESWFAHNASGGRVMNTKFGNYLMNVAGAGWIEYVNKTCAEYIAYGNYDGCLLDALGPAPLVKGWLNSMPVNPDTGQLWTKYDYIGANANIVRTTKERVGSKLVIPNGVTWGRDYFSPNVRTDRLVMAGDGGFVELFMRAQNVGVNDFRKEAEWKMDVDMLADAEARGKTIFTTTKVWVNATQTQKDQWHRYALASFLLGSGGASVPQGGSYFTFLYDHDALKTHSWWQHDLGTPLGSYTKTGGIYQRNFTGGHVLVNPTPTTQSSALTTTSSSLVTLTGTPVTGSITMPPFSGQVLLES
jgi:hypothetical protein